MDMAKEIESKIFAAQEMIEMIEDAGKMITYIDAMFSSKYISNA